MKNFVKNHINYLLLVALMTTGIACKDDNNDPLPVNENKLAGNWKLSAMNVNPAMNGITDILAFLVATTGNDCIKRISFEFKKNGLITGSTPQDCIDEENGDIITENSKWELQGNKLKITDTEGEVTLYDLDISGNTMNLKFEEADEENPAQKYMYTMVFKK